jgi:ATP-binding cassette, subfamily B, multidrug efflux pump
LSQIGDKTLFRRSLAFVWPHKKLLVAGALILPLAALCQLILPYLLKVVIDGPIKNRSVEGIAGIAVIFLVVTLAHKALALAKVYIMQLLGQRVITDIRRKLFNRVARLSMAYHDREPTGKIINRLTNDIDSLNEFLSSGLVQIVTDLFLLIGVVIAMFLLDPMLALYSLALMPFLILFLMLARRLMRKLFSRLSTKNARALSYSQEILSGLVVIQAFRREDASSQHYEQLTRDALAENLNGVWWSSHISALVELASYVSIGLLLFFGTSQTTSLGVLFAFIEYVQMFYRPVEGLSGRFAVLQKALASGEKIFLLFDDCERYSDPSGAIEAQPLSDSIQFKNVTFSYVDGHPVLKNFNLNIKKGSTVAIVGATGAGKSSLVKLLGCYYRLDVDSGSILWDGQQLEQLTLGSLRKRVAYVPQETFLFSDTLSRNIDLGAVDNERAVEAARVVGASRVAADLPQGFEELIGEQGRNLSAGERQLIAFARALAQDPDVLILDEATANIDGETEAIIQESLRVLLRGRTAIVIAHRLSTIRDADDIVVLHKGEIREQGHHDQLIAARGLYYTLYNLQGGAPG